MGNTYSYCDDTATQVPKTEPTPDVKENPAAEEPSEPAPKPRRRKPKFWTAPIDPRFRSTNQARACYARYNEFYKCKAEKDEDSEECLFYKRCYEIICPNEWIENWEEMREEGLWAGRY